MKINGAPKPGSLLKARNCLLALLSVVLLSTPGCSDFLNSSLPGDRGGTRPSKPISPTTDPTEDPQSGELTTEKVILAMGQSVLAPLSKELDLAASEMVQELENLCGNEKTSLLSFPSTTQDAWKNLAAKSHRVLALPVGPLTAKAGVLRDQINSWPSLNLCGLDHEVVKQSQGQAPNKQLLYTSKGLAALEYLIFEPSQQTVCNPNNKNNQAPVTWSQKPAEKKRLDRCRTALWLAQELQSSAKVLAEAWDPGQGNYAASMINGSRGGLKDSLTALSDALFGIEFAKDTQLGKPLGFHKDCLLADRKCPAMAEHPYSNFAIQAVVHRLEAFRALFTGALDPEKSGLRGFDDLLAQAGHQSVATSVVAAIDQAIESGRALQSQRLQDLIATMDAAACHASNTTNRTVPVCAWHSEVRNISVRLKTDVLSVLSLREPPTHAGDND